MINIHSTLSGHFNIKVIDTVTNKITSEYDFSNLITDEGLSLFGENPRGWIITSRCKVGTGTTVPQPSDLDLAATVAQADAASYNTSLVNDPTSNTRYAVARSVFRFAKGAAVGNLSEIGIFRVNNSAMFSRSLIRDNNGNPTIISPQASEILEITYELRVNLPIEDVVTTKTINGVEYTFTLRPALLSNSDAFRFVNRGIQWEKWTVNYYYTTLNIYKTPISSAHTDSPDESGILNRLDESRISKTYIAPNTCRLTGAITSNEANDSNGISSWLMATSMGGYQVGISPPLLKTKDFTMQVELSFTWSRA